ncbi:hypothetical protein GQ42DRAFT_160027 [Ramicandelaber brevisporus]|nr:hypothetical protein GQ42DRAFT_160027 [Ramicandelaber brevisporus]
MHIVDYFVADGWSKLDPQWQSALLDDRFTLDDCIALADNGDIPDYFPDGLRDFIAQSRELQLPRQPIHDMLATGGGNKSGGNNTNNGAPDRLHPRLIPGMNPKKQTEVRYLAHLVATTARQVGASFVVDLGAGQGYLSRAIAHEHNIPVFGVDSDENQTNGAIQMLKATVKRGWKIGDGRAGVSHSTIRVTHENLDTLKQFIKECSESARAQLHPRQQQEQQQQQQQQQQEQQVRKRKLDDGDSFQEPAKWILCSLHSCGDLSSNMLRLFAQSDASAVVNVSCCYNLISEMQCDSHASNDNVGFPLSQSIRDSGVYFGMNPLKAACQTPSRWETQRSASLDSFTRNYYRALLHYAMVDTGLVSQDDAFPVVGKLSKSAFAGDFAVYAREALPRLGYTDAAVVERICEHGKYDQAFPNGLRQLAVIWTLKALLGPLIESTILADRCLYLASQPQVSHVKMFPLVDVVTSPRNITIIGIK